MADGQIRKRSKQKNTWEIRVELPRVDGKRRIKTITVEAKNEREARRSRNKLQAQYQDDTYKEPSKQLLAGYLTSWLENLATFKPVRQNTLERYDEIVHKHLIPALGSISLADLKPMDITAYYKQALQSGNLKNNGPLSPTNVRHHHNVLHRALQRAVEQELVLRNPATAADYPEYDNNPPRALSREELGMLLKRLQQSYIFLPSYLSVMTGGRQSEILGLKWCDIDYEQRLVFFERSLHCDKQGWYFDHEMKSKNAKRDVDIDKPVLAVLTQNRREQERYKEMLGPSYHDLDLVCCRPDGSPLNGDNISKRFTVLARSIGLNKVSFHSMRHTYTTLLLEEGIDIKDVSRLLGHGTPEFTYSRYAHYTRRSKKKAAQVMAGIVHGALEFGVQVGVQNSCFAVNSAGKKKVEQP